MSVSALARRSGVSRATVLRMLRDQKMDFTFGNFFAVAEALGVSLSGEEIPAALFKDQAATKQAQRVVRLTQGNVALESQAVNHAALDLRIYNAKSRIAASDRKLWAS
jgi:transcriptional regulator with XRE-family HTH domain